MSASCLFNLEYKGKETDFAPLWKVLHAIEGKSVVDVEGSTELYDKQGNSIETSNERCRAIWGKDAWNPTAELYLLMAKSAPKLRFKTSSSRTDEGGGRGCYTEDKCVFEKGKLVFEKSARVDSMTIAEILWRLIEEEEYGCDEESEDFDDYYDACDEFQEELWSGDVPTSDLYTSFSYKEFCKYFDVDDTVTEAVFEEKKKANDYLYLSMTNKASTNDIWEKEEYYIDSEGVIRDKDNNIDSNMMEAITKLEKKIKPLIVTQKPQEQKTIKEIKDEEYKGQEMMTEMIVPEGVERIGARAFYGCSLMKKIEIPKSVNVIGANAFEGCFWLGKITIPQGVKKIEDNTFFNCAMLKKIVIPETVTKIGKSAFAGCAKLTQIVIPEAVTTIGDRAFSGCSELSQINIPNKVKKISSYMFINCKKLTEIRIPEKVTTIGTYAFAGCSNLTKVEIPEGVTKIGQYAFAYCSNLEQIVIPESVIEIGKGAFEGTKIKL